MSYGLQKATSAITLAVMEDLNLGYVANYERAECLHWGRNQGCAFITSRCAVGRHDRSVPVSGPAACRGLASWPDHDAHVEDVCAFGSDPCRDAYREGRCDAQCATESTSCAVNNMSHVSRHSTPLRDASVLLYVVWVVVAIALYGSIAEYRVQ